MDKILVAVDGSESADRALMKAKEIGSVFNSTITILHVIEDLSNPDAFHMSLAAGNSASVQRKLKAQSIELLETYKEKFKDYKGQVDTLTGKGKPGDTIIRVAKEDDYSLIIMGNRGLGPVAGAMLGSVSHKVVNKSAISVLIVK